MSTSIQRTDIKKLNLLDSRVAEIQSQFEQLFSWILIRFGHEDTFPEHLKNLKIPVDFIELKTDAEGSESTQNEDDYDNEFNFDIDKGLEILEKEIKHLTKPCSVKINKLDEEEFQFFQNAPIPATPRKDRRRRRKYKIQKPAEPKSTQETEKPIHKQYTRDLTTKLYKCDICDKATTSWHAMEAHCFSHSGQKFTVCEICGKGFFSNANLIRHRLIHTGEKPYKCSHCGESFNQAISLKVHVRIHTGEKPFECSGCGNRFMTKAYVRKHRCNGSRGGILNQIENGETHQTTLTPTRTGTDTVDPARLPAIPTEIV